MDRQICSRCCESFAGTCVAWTCRSSSLRGAYLQGVEMQDTTLAGATLRETVFTESFDPPWSVATSSQWALLGDGQQARGSTRVA